MRKKKGTFSLLVLILTTDENKTKQIDSESKKMDPQLLNSLPEEDKTKMVAMIETMQTRDR